MYKFTTQHFVRLLHPFFMQLCLYVCVFTYILENCICISVCVSECNVLARLSIPRYSAKQKFCCSARLHHVTMLFFKMPNTLQSIALVYRQVGFTWQKFLNLMFQTLDSFSTCFLQLLRFMSVLVGNDMILSYISHLPF